MSKSVTLPREIVLKIYSDFFQDMLRYDYYINWDESSREMVSSLPDKDILYLLNSKNLKKLQYKLPFQEKIVSTKVLKKLHYIKHVKSKGVSLMKLSDLLTEFLPGEETIGYYKDYIIYRGNYKIFKLGNYFFIQFFNNYGSRSNKIVFTLQKILLNYK